MKVPSRCLRCNRCGRRTQKKMRVGELKVRTTTFSDAHLFFRCRHRQKVPTNLRAEPLRSFVLYQHAQMLHVVHRSLHTPARLGAPLSLWCSKL